jgi:hypothetical protein
MAQQGQVLRLRTRREDGKSLWVYRYRVDGRCSKRPQVAVTRHERRRSGRFPVIGLGSIQAQT